VLLCLSLIFSQVNAQKIERLIIKNKTIGKREVLVYLPNEYVDQNRSFEVVYVLDAQNREFFDVVHSTISFQNNGLKPMIVVGIKSPIRNIDFLPKNLHADTYKEQFGQLGGADDFRDFIEDDLMPFIEKKYRTIPTKIGIGFSNGGTFMNYVMLGNSRLFDVIFSIDANFNYDQGQLLELISKKSSFDDLDFYYTCYTKQGDLWIRNSHKFNEYLRSISLMAIESEIFELESHSSVYQQAILNAFKAYFNYQFFNAQNLVQYLNELGKNERYVIQKDELHRLASAFAKFGRVEDARFILNSFKNNLNAEIVGYDIYALFQTADLYLTLGFNEQSKKYFLYCDKILEEKKKKYGDDLYNFGKAKISEKLKLLE